jgi:hypothetical protein
VKARFGETAVWPAPSDDGVEAVAWAVCAESIMLLETATAHSEWMTVSHEANSADPLAAFRKIFEHLSLPWTEDVARALSDSNKPGVGYETNRRAAEEATRWRSRLPEGDQAIVRDVIASFEAVSPAAAALWQTSPALA